MATKRRDASVAMVGYGEMLCGDVVEAHMADQPAPGINHPAWILGHLALTADYAATMLGGAGVCPAEWTAVFDQKKPLSTNRADYPSKADLLATLRRATENAIEHADALAPADAAKPHNQGWFEKELPTMGDMMSFLLVGHPGIHLGQLSAWRRMTGGAPLF